jgi:hypothetical protein
VRVTEMGPSASAAATTWTVQEADGRRRAGQSWVSEAVAPDAARTAGATPDASAKPALVRVIVWTSVRGSGSGPGVPSIAREGLSDQTRRGSKPLALRERSMPPGTPEAERRAVAVPLAWADAWTRTVQLSPAGRLGGQYEERIWKAMTPGPEI